MNVFLIAYEQGNENFGDYYLTHLRKILAKIIIRF